MPPEDETTEDLNAFREQTLAGLDAHADAEDPVVERMEADGIVPVASPAPAPTPAQAPAAGPAAAPAAPAQSPSPGPAAPAPQAAPAPSGGDHRQALRAARHEARQANERAAALQAEIERLRANAPPPPPSPLEAALARVKEEMPDVATVLEAAVPKPAAAPPAAPAPPAGFVPERIPDALQAAVDDVAQALEWQHSPEHQDRWNLLKMTDGVLYAHPAWKDKPLAERIEEAVRRVNAELGAPGAGTPGTNDPLAAAARAPQRPLSTLSDLGGGLSHDHATPNYDQMTQEQILASLDRLEG